MFTDFQVITTEDGVAPTESSAMPLDGSEGRGSVVLYNQASLFQAAELPFPTVGMVQAAGLNAACDNARLAEAGIFTAGMSQVQHL